ncbi:TIGR02678 family protein [Kitasatospora sp. NPDC088134]|uniref:TIGR02678 family protein n=1 Tax=Kitasatospora sp. NPDC088134 TaxID=3364071 RepID=UPI00380917D0
MVRALLRRPLVKGSSGQGQVVALARKHHVELRAWFDHHLGWPLYVERDRVRLYKIPADPGRPGPPVPSARQCVLYCLALAAIEDAGQQTVISHLAERIGALTAAHPAIRQFDAAQLAERRDLVAAIRLLVRDGVLAPTRDTGLTATDERGYVEGVSDALYDVGHRAAALLLSSPTPPAQATGPDGLLAVDDGFAPAGVEQTSRHAVMRRLVDHPVVYLDELSAEERRYLLDHRREVLQALRGGLGVRVEVRQEGWAVIDDELTDEPLLGQKTASFGALLLADRLFHEVAAKAPESRYVSEARLLELAAPVGEQLLRVVQNLDRKPITADRLVEVAVPILIGFGLVAESIGGGIEIRPALARYRDPTGAGARLTSHTTMTFGHQPPDPASETNDV